MSNVTQHPQNGLVESRAELPSTQSQMAGIVSVIDRVASNPEIDVEKLQKMLEMQERILDRQAKQEYTESLAAMQGRLPAVEKKARGQSSMYAKLEDVIAAVRPVMQEYGFSISHRTSVENGMVLVTGVLSHRNGHSESITLPLPIDTSGNKNSVQAVGSSIEYGRRYTTNALLGIATRDADTDGVTQGSATALSPNQAKQLRAELKKAGIAEIQFCTKVQIQRLEDLHPNRLPGALNFIKSYKG